MKKVAFFDAKPYDREWFDKVNTQYDIRYVESKLTPATVQLAAGADAIAKTPVDGSKGTMLSFRPWDGQLRQPMLLTDGQGVIATAPVEGLLHPRDVLDTLGVDAPEKLCKARQ